MCVGAEFVFEGREGTDVFFLDLYLLCVCGYDYL